MKNMVLALGLILLTAGCRVDSPATPASPPQNGTPSTLQTSGGGGVDSSGGDLLTSSVSDVEDSVNDIEAKTYKVLFRIATELSSAEKTDFEMKFGEGTYSNVRNFMLSEEKFSVQPTRALKAKRIQFKLQDDSCEGDQQAKAGSASWIADQASVCLSKHHLRKMSPDSLQMDTLALAVHEVSHLYGFNETQAQALQSFVLKNRRLVWPDMEQVKTALDKSNEATLLSVQLLQQFTEKKNSELCKTVEQLNRDVSELYVTRDHRTSLVLPSLASDNLGFAGILISSMAEACYTGNADKIIKAVAGAAPEVFLRTSYVNEVIRLYANPVSPGALIPTFDMLNVLSLIENNDLMKLGFPKVSRTARIEMSDVFCKVQRKDSGASDFSAPELIVGTQFYGDRNSGVGSMGASGSGNEIYMLRRVSGQRGLGFGIMTDKIEFLNVSGMFTTNGGGKPEVQVEVAAMIPGVTNEFQFEYSTATSAVRARCGYKLNDKLPDLEFKVRPKRDKNTKDINDSYFLAKPATPVSMSVKLNGDNQADVSGGPVVSNGPITRIRFNGNIILDTADDQCIIPASLFKARNENAEEIAQGIRDGKYSEVICEMNGSLRQNGKAGHASWAFSYQIK